MDRTRIEVYAGGGAKFREAYAGLSQAELLADVIPGTWTLQQIAVHLMDSDLIASDRMKRIAAMDKPLIIGYDETAFNRLPGVNELALDDVIQSFDQNRQMTATILRRLTDEHYERWGIHNEAGKITLAEMVDNYIQHLDYHLEWVAKKVHVVASLRDAN